MEHPRYHNSPRPRRKTPIPTHRSLKKRVWAKFTVLVLLSPILLPLGIILSPFLLWNAWRDRKEQLAEQKRRAREKKTPPPPIDPELERRRELARRTNKRRDSRIPMLYDPISDDPVYAWAIKEAGQIAREEMGELLTATGIPDVCGDFSERGSRRNKRVCHSRRARGGQTATVYPFSRRV